MSGKSALPNSLLARPTPRAGLRRVLVTGAAGHIGRYLLPELERDFCVRAFDRVPVEGACENVIGDLTDAVAVRAATADVDAIIHLAGTKKDRAFVEDLVPNNIVGTYNVFEAARLAGVRRLVFASSVQSAAPYPPDCSEPGARGLAPSTLYGVTKALGESMGRHYFDRYGLEFVGVRIGWFLEADDSRLRQRGSYARQVWISPRDCTQLLRCALQAPVGPDFDGYTVVFGTSRVEGGRLSLREARALGYKPRDDVKHIALESEIMSEIVSVACASVS